MVKSSVGGALGSTASLSGAMARGLGATSSDEDFKKVREREGREGRLVICLFVCLFVYVFTEIYLFIYLFIFIETRRNKKNESDGSSIRYERNNWLQQQNVKQTFFLLGFSSGIHSLGRGFKSGVKGVGKDSFFSIHFFPSFY